MDIGQIVLPTAHSMSYQIFGHIMMNGQDWRIGHQSGFGFLHPGRALPGIGHCKCLLEQPVENRIAVAGIVNRASIASMHAKKIFRSREVSTPAGAGKREIAAPETCEMQRRLGRSDVPPSELQSLMPISY